VPNIEVLAHFFFVDEMGSPRFGQFRFVRTERSLEAILTGASSIPVQNVSLIDRVHVFLVKRATEDGRLIDTNLLLEQIFFGTSGVSLDGSFIMEVALE